MKLGIDFEDRWLRAIPISIFFCILIVLPSRSYAYIGPGAGFVFLGSFLILIAGFAVAFGFFITWPFRLLRRRVSKRATPRGKFDRVLIVGFDGLDPRIVEDLRSKGKLPNIDRVISVGSFRTMLSTCPPISPVAWSSFSTGVNPGKHNIFDFLAPDRKTYLPKLSSADIRPPTRWLSFGPYRIPLSKPSFRLMRKSKPFWSVLSEYGIFSSIIRVPITFPPEKFEGLLLSSLCVPDLRGTQGSFSFYTTNKDAISEHTGGFAYMLYKKNGGYEGDLVGPENLMRRGSPPLKLRFRIEVKEGNSSAVLRIGRKRWYLEVGRYSPWIRIEFSAGLGVRVSGIALFLLKSIYPHVELYVTPINIDPERPAMPVSHPSFYSIYLAKLHGAFATLGLAEDTWALNEGIIDDSQFIEQAYLFNIERERIFFDEIRKVKKGVVACVFDVSDRIQHMFWRYLESDHPANRVKPPVPGKNPIEELYLAADRIVGRILDAIDDRTALIIISDHGFASFRRGVNLNTWLWKEGYLALKENAKTGDWFEGVDWSRTKAYAFGLGGIYINLKGREGQGVVDPQERDNLVMEIKDLLTGLRDDEKGRIAIKAVYDSHDVYAGPYLDEAPDLIIGYNEGYRASWEGVTGKVTGSVFSDNQRAWSGDHCVDPSCVPAVLITNRKIMSASPRIQDIAPSVLNLLGVSVPAYMDGEVILE